MFCVHYYRSWLYGKYFEIHTVHNCLVYHTNFKCHTLRLNRLTLKLVEFNFKIVDKTGASLRIADLLSRSPIKKEIDQNVCTEEELINIYDICINMYD